MAEQFVLLPFACLRANTCLRLPVRDRTQTGATHRQAYRQAVFILQCRRYLPTLNINLKIRLISIISAPV